jgi:hypothetical protein
MTEAFTLASNALQHLPEHPGSALGELTPPDGTRTLVLVTPTGITSPPGESSSTYVAPTEAIPVVPEFDDYSDAPGVLPLDDDLDDEDDDDAEAIHAHAQKLRTTPRARLGLIIVAAVVLVLAMVGFLALQANAGGDPEPTPTAQAGLTRDPISPWTTETSWAQSVNPDGRIGATPDGSHIATISTANALTITDPSTGEEVATAQLAETPSIGPRGTTIGGKNAVVVRAADTLTAWIDGADPLTVDLTELDSPTVVSFAGDEPLLMAEDGTRTWRITPTGLAEPTMISEAYRPYAMQDDGTMLAGAAGPARVLTLDADGDVAEEVELTSPDSGADLTPTRWLTVRPTVTVLLWQGDKTDKSGTLTIHDTSTGEVASTTVATNVGLLQQATAVSSDRSTLLGVPGYLIDSANPEQPPVSVAGFQPTAATGQFLFGRDRTGARAIVRAQTGEMEVLDANALVPWTITDSGLGLVVEGSTAYAVKRGPEPAPTDTPTQDSTGTTEPTEEPTPGQEPTGAD